MDKFSHLFLLCGLLILPSLALSSVTSSNVIKLGTTRNSTKGNVTESKTYNASSNNLAQNTTGNINTSTYSVNNPTSPAIHHSSNVTNSDTLQKSGVPSTAAPTISTTVEYNMSTTITSFVIDKSTGIQSASEPTATTLTTASMILSSPITPVTVSNLSTTNTTPAYLTTNMTLDNQTNKEATGPGLNNSEKSMTIFFSMVLGVIVLIILVQLVYKVSRSKQRSVQYSHHPLYNDDAGDQSGVPDDTLVISGGLYDGPQIYNPTVTALNDEDQPTFSYTPTQFCLEFLHDDQQADHGQEATASELFNMAEQKS